MTCKVLREENSQPSIQYQAKLPFKNMKTRLRHSQITNAETVHHSRPALQEMEKGPFQAEMKGQ